MLGFRVMKALFREIYDEMDAELSKSPDLRVQQLIDLDENLDAGMAKFESGLTQDQRAEWDELRGMIDELRRYAKLAKMRLIAGDEAVKERLREIELSMENTSEYQEAEVEIERSMHQTKGIGDVFKALLMWKDSPEERLAAKREEEED